MKTRLKYAGTAEAASGLVEGDVAMCTARRAVGGQQSFRQKLGSSAIWNEIASHFSRKWDDWHSASSDPASLRCPSARPLLGSSQSKAATFVPVCASFNCCRQFPFTEFKIGLLWVLYKTAWGYQPGF